MIKKFLALALLITGFLLVGNAYGEEDVYYCADIDGNGFYYDEKESSHKRTGFKSRKFKILLDRTSKTINLARDNGKTELYSCVDSFDENILSCTTDFYHFNFNINNGRFVSMVGYGYVGGVDTLAVSYGKCDKF
jgi:hypothetical protein